MKVLILGANGQLGPHVVKALEGEHTLRLTDINDRPDTPHEYIRVDASDLDHVVEVAEGMDAIVNLSVLRWDRKIAFDVNTRGCYNAMRAAVAHGIRRVINTGPHYSIAGPTYEQFDYAIGPDIPTQSGTNLYGISKSVGQEICRVFTENHDIYLLMLLFYNFKEGNDHSMDGQDFTPFTVSWEDAGQSFRAALSIPLDRLASRCEVFNIFADIPHDKFSNEKARRVLGWQPANSLDQFWKKFSNIPP